MAGTTTIATGSAHRLTDAPIDGAALGAEFLGWEHMNGFAVRHAEVGFTHLRWPGAIPAEDGMDVTGDGVRDAVFDLGFDNLVDWRRWAGDADKADGVPEGTQREGLSDMLAYATDHDLSFAMIVPTARYAQEAIETGDTAAALDHARDDMADFVTRLAAGDFGAVPARMTLEIGTEYYATHVWKNLNADPDDNVDGTDRTTDADLARVFGEVFAVMSREAQDTLDQVNATGANAAGVDLHIAVQTGRFQSAPDAGHMDGQPADDATFIEAFDDHDALDAIDALIWHRYVPEFDQLAMGLSQDIHGTSLAQVTDQWETAAGRPLDLVGGWMAPTPQQDNDTEFGAPSLTSILQGFSEFAAAGMDIGTIFGLGFGQTGSLGNGTTTYIGGQLYTLMQESLPGTHLLDGFHENTTPAIGDALVRDDSVNVYAFEDADSVTVFLAAKDFPGAHLDFTVEVEGEFIRAETTHLIDPDGIDTITQQNIGVVGELRTEPDVDIVQSDGAAEVSLRFGTDYEVIRLTLDKGPADAPAGGPDPDPSIPGGEAPLSQVSSAAAAEPATGGPGRDRIVVDESDDPLRGMAGDDTLVLLRGDGRLYGGAGDDVLEVARGNATLSGGDGNDRLVLVSGNGVLGGGAGHDILSGGRGADEFVFVGGHDVITDFDPAEDRLRLAPDLFGDAADPFDALAGLAAGGISGTTINFGDAGSLTLSGIASLADLTPDVFVFAAPPAALDEGLIL